MTKLKTTKPQSQLEKVISLFPKYHETKLNAECDTMGNILRIETDDTALITILKAEGLV